MKKTTSNAKAKIVTAILFAAILLNSFTLVVAADDEYEDTTTETSYEEVLDDYEKEDVDESAEETEDVTHADNQIATIAEPSFGIEGPSTGVIITEKEEPEVVDPEEITEYGKLWIMVVDQDWNPKTGVDFKFTSVKTGKVYDISVDSDKGVFTTLPVGEYTGYELPGDNNKGILLATNMYANITTERSYNIFVMHTLLPTDPTDPINPTEPTEPVAPPVTTDDGSGTTGSTSYGKSGKSTDSTSDSRNGSDVVFDPFRDEVIEQVVEAIEIEDVEIVSDDDSFMYNTDDTANPDTGKGPAYSLYALAVFAAGMIVASITLFAKSKGEDVE